MDVIALGELLIDFMPVQTGNTANPSFEQHPGGAPANVLVSLARLGKRTGFIGKVGNDQFGRFLRDVLTANDVDAAGLVASDEVNTTLAFVHLDAKGDRSFSFYRRPGADTMLTEQDVDFRIIQNARVFHFGSVSMTDEPARSTTLKAAEYARNNGIFVSYDPNLRAPLWRDLSEAKDVLHEGAAYANLIKVSEEELHFLVDTTNLNEGSRRLAQRHGLKLVLVTLGSNGCFYRLGEATGHVPGFEVKTVDTTGAGDAFLGGFLASLLDSQTDGVQDIRLGSPEDVEKFIHFANAVGALTTTAKGAISAIPARETVRAFLQRSGSTKN